MSEAKQGAENRRHRRVPVTFAVVYTVESPFELRLEIGKREIDAIANDLSVSGLSLMTNYQIPTGAVITMHFKLMNKAAVLEEDRVRKFALQGEARYSFFGKEKAYRVGILFLNLTPADRDFIARCV